MCRFADVPHPLYADTPGPNATKVCDGTGDMLACLICPASLTNWALTAPPPVANPYANRGPKYTAEDAAADREREREAVRASVAHLISGEGWYWDRFGEGPCVLCTVPTSLCSPKKVYCHKACAEEYNAGRRRFAEPR